MMIRTTKPIVKISAIVFAAAVILATTFHVIQSSKQGCWTGDETTNFEISDDKVMCCDGVNIIECALDGVQCLQTGSAPYC